VELVFLLSMCTHVDKWRQLLKLCRDIADSIVFESTSSSQQQADQLSFLGELFRGISVPHEDSKRRIVLARK
jgi:hypothetical protein